MTERQPHRVLIVDDHEVVRRGLTTVLDRHPGLRVVGEASTMAEAVKLARSLTPDVVVMDVRLPDGTGVEACRQIRSENPAIKVVMLTSYSDEEAVMGAIMAGASGYLLKEIGSVELVQAVQRVAAGQSLLDPSVTARVLERIRSGSAEDQKWAQLTAQERQVLELVAKGKTNREISQEVHLSEKTVKNYVSRILAKLDLSRRSQAAAYLVERQARRAR